MAITVKYLEGLGVDKEVAEKIFAERGSEIEKEKEKYSALEKELKESKDGLKKMKEELETLKAENASGEALRSKLEALKAEYEEKEKRAEADRILKEKQEGIKKRFIEAVGEKKFYNAPTREYYLKKFGEAIEDKSNEGIGDKELFHSLVKDDSTAFKGVEFVRLAGGNPAGNGINADEAKARAVMGLSDKK